MIYDKQMRFLTESESWIHGEIHLTMTDGRAVVAYSIDDRRSHTEDERRTDANESDRCLLINGLHISLILILFKCDK